MNSTEYEKILAWSDKYENIYSFAVKDDGTDSYYESPELVGSLISYEFNTLPELEQKIQDIWNSSACFEELTKMCAIAAFKNKPEENLTDTVDENKEFAIPEYVYAF